MSEFAAEGVPKARWDDLVIEMLDEEVLVYDVRVHKAICLNASAALIWDLSDGRRTVADIVDELGNAEITHNHVAEILDVLRENNLLEDNAMPRSDVEAAPQSRRFFLAPGADASPVLPAVMTMIVPAAAQAKPPTCLNDIDACDQVCCENGPKTGRCVPLDEWLNDCQ